MKIEVELERKTIGIPAKLFKCTADLLAHTIANISNKALEVHEPLGLGKGVLI